MSDFDELLEDDEDSQVIDADFEEPGFQPEYAKDDGVVISEPPIVSIGRAKRRKYLRELQDTTGSDQLSSAREVLPEDL